MHLFSISKFQLFFRFIKGNCFTIQKTLVGGTKKLKVRLNKGERCIRDFGIIMDSIVSCIKK